MVVVSTVDAMVVLDFNMVSGRHVDAVPCAGIKWCWPPL
jgi:hypothetical protein